MTKTIIYAILMSATTVFAVKQPLPKTSEASLTVTSSAFSNNQPIPVQFTCDCSNVSPPLSFAKVPKEAKSLVLIMDDPDAPKGTWVHWVLYDMLPTTTELPQEITSPNTLKNVGRVGVTSFDTTGYGGPCPPNGTHHYFFKLYALDKKLGFPPGKSKKEIELAMKGHVIGYGELVGVYTR